LKKIFLLTLVLTTFSFSKIILIHEKRDLSFSFDRVYIENNLLNDNK